MNFTYERHPSHTKHLCTEVSTLAGWSGLLSPSALDTAGWSGPYYFCDPKPHCPIPDDPAPTVFVSPNPTVQFRMIRHYPGWSRPETFWTFLLPKNKIILSDSGWSDSVPDDPDLGVFECVLAYFVTHSDDPRIPRMIRNSQKTHITVTCVGGAINIPSPPSFTSLFSPDQPSSKSIHSLTLLHPKARFLQRFT